MSSVNSGVHPYRKASGRRAFAPTKLYHELYPKKLKSIIMGGRSPLKLLTCASYNNLHELRMWLSTGVSPNSTDSQKRSCMHIAASKGFDEMVRVLLAAGANPNKKDILGNTPLHLAFSAGHTKVCITLMTNGASSNIKDERGNTVWDLLISKVNILRGCLSRKQISPSSFCESVTEVMKMVPYILETMEIQVAGESQVTDKPSECPSEWIKGVLECVKVNKELAAACADPSISNSPSFELVLKNVLEDIENLTINKRGRTAPTIKITASCTESNTEEPMVEHYDRFEMYIDLFRDIYYVDPRMYNLECQLKRVKLSNK